MHPEPFNICVLLAIESKRRNRMCFSQVTRVYQIQMLLYKELSMKKHTPRAVHTVSPLRKGLMTFPFAALKLVAMID